MKIVFYSLLLFIFLVNGGWAGWSSWSQCSVSCGVGIIERSRNCSNPAPLHSGLMCSTGLSGVLALTQNEKTTCFMGTCAFPGICRFNELK